MKKAEREIYLKEKLVKMREIENGLYIDGYLAIAGTDEVGRGPLAGPVIAATVVLPEDFDVIGIDDSKKLSAKRREEFFKIINEKALAVGTGTVPPERIDKINILNASKEAMTASYKSANENLKKKYQSEIEYLLTDAVELKDIPVPQMNIIKGDEKSISIAAASIIAKVTRDRLMIKMDSQYPGYGFASNKGYGTKRHYEGLRALGVCPIHRRSFLREK